MKAAVLLAVAAFASACAGASRRGRGVETVTARGWAAADASDPAAARRRALTDALARAVEQVDGVSLSARTSVRDGVVAEQRIAAAVRGRVRRYRILTERAAPGLVEVSIRADVEQAGQAGACAPLSVSLEVSDPGVERGLARGLARGGCITQGAGGAAVRLRASSRSFAVRDARTAPFLSYGAEVELRAVDPASGAVLWSGARRAAALGLDEASASSRALEQAGELAAAVASRELPAAVDGRR